MMDKALETEMKTLETQHNIVKNEYDSVKKIIDDHASKDFKYIS